MKEFIWVSIITWTLDGRWQLLDVYRGWTLGIMAECPRGMDHCEDEPPRLLEAGHVTSSPRQKIHNSTDSHFDMGLRATYYEPIKQLLNITNI